jgi:hypothetical protein
MLRFLKPPQCTYSSLKTRTRHCTYTTMSLPQDIEDFLSDYPGAGNSTSKSLNLRFYRNEARCRPDNLFIDDLHAQYAGAPGGKCRNKSDSFESQMEGRLRHT